MPLTDTTIRTVKPTGKTQRLFDGGGLYLELSPAGGKWWRLKYRFGGKEKRISLGVYPDVDLDRSGFFLPGTHYRLTHVKAPIR